ncbi:MAG TPA: ATP cone domain-containing protein, partial [Candidatus Wunengus sp. YC63]
MNTTATIEYVLKRDGRKVPFNERKIADAIFKAAHAVGGEDRALADELAVVVSMFLEKKYSGQAPGIEDIQDIVEKILIETGHAKTAKAYILYRDKRARSRESLRVRKQTKKRADTTDVSLLVNTETKDETFSWDKRKIAEALEKEADLSEEVSGEIAGAVEQRVFSSGLNRISTALIRELVDNELFERGFNKKLEKQQVIGMPKYDLEELIMSKNKENSNIATNNPEAINLAIAENTLKQYA